MTEQHSLIPRINVLTATCFVVALDRVFERLTTLTTTTLDTSRETPTAGFALPFLGEANDASFLRHYYPCLANGVRMRAIEPFIMHQSRLGARNSALYDPWTPQNLTYVMRSEAFARHLKEVQGFDARESNLPPRMQDTLHMLFVGLSSFARAFLDMRQPATFTRDILLHVVYSIEQALASLSILLDLDFAPVVGRIRQIAGVYTIPQLSPLSVDDFMKATFEKPFMYFSLLGLGVVTTLVPPANMSVSLSSSPCSSPSSSGASTPTSELSSSSGDSDDSDELLAFVASVPMDVFERCSTEAWRPDAHPCAVLFSFPHPLGFA